MVCIVLIALAAAPRAFAKRPNPTPSPADALADYVAAPDDSYAWKLRRSGKFMQGDFVELTLTSQTWRDQKWRHQLFIYRPSQVTKSTNALLLITGGDWKDALAEAPAAGEEQMPREAAVIAQIAEALHTPVAIVCQVPEQPLFDGMHEDEIISYTFAKYCETGDTDWPLLLPMVKSAVRAMDAVEEFARQEWKVEIDKFVVTGASKRGWTTWLTAAVDPRVCGLAPLVINMLNM
ncbi:MAG: PhoPQ-activated protein PqaA family protein, partial [Pirellulales bacterium]